MSHSLPRRLDQPLAWLVAFGVPAIFGGAVAGWTGEMPGGVFGGAAIVGIGVGGLGLVFGLIAWSICKAIGGLDVPVRRPERWGRPVRCLACGWKTPREGPVSRRDCLCSPETCPNCSALVIHFIPDCPNCQSSLMTGDGVLKDMFRLVRWPKTFGQAFFGHYRCRDCGCEFDRWGIKQG